MGDRRCCCGECFLFEDSFTHADSTTVDNWNEVTGDWGITSNQLVEKYSTSEGTANAIIICTQPVPERSKGEMDFYITVPVSAIEDGDVYCLYPACTDTSTVGPIKVTFTWVESTSAWTTRIYVNDVLEDEYETYLVGTSPEIVLTLRCCVDREVQGVKAWIDPTANEWAAWVDEVDPGEGRYAGIGHNNTGHLNCFDNFHLEEIRRPTEICEECFCVCDLYTVPTRLLATIKAAAGNRASCLNNMTFYMSFYNGDVLTSRPQAVTWRGNTTLYGEELEWELICGGNQAGTFTLNWTQCGRSGHNCSTLGTEATCAQTPKTADETSTCNPFYLHFTNGSPYLLSWLFDCDLCYSKMDPNCVIDYNALCDGEFYIEITEAPEDMPLTLETGDFLTTEVPEVLTYE